MTGPSPLLIVTLSARTVDEARQQAARAAASGGDVAEVRLDRWSPAERARVGELFPSSLPLMATLRSSAEGGEGPNDASARSEILTACLHAPFQWIDLEEDRDPTDASSLGVPRDRIVVRSTHFPEGTPASELIARLRRPVRPGEFRKVVVRSTVRRLLLELLPSLRAVDLRSEVFLTTGPSGPLLRARAQVSGYPFVYAAPADPGPRAPMDPVEPSQIPVDRLRFFFGGDGSAPIYGVVGRPVAHSWSPGIHYRWMREGHRRGLYVPLEIESESEFVEAIDPLVEQGFRGLNVTHPWKTAALACATHVGRGAELCGVANCLTLRGDEVEAENTDLAAILRRLEELRSTGAWAGDELLVLGTGGAAAATLAAARELGASSWVMGRSSERADDLARAFGAIALSRGAVRPFSLVVHATDVGRGLGRSLELPLERAIRRGGRVVDWVYAADDPIVAQRTREAEAEYEDGWRLLVYQAAVSFGLWWGSEPSAQEIDRTVTEEACAG